MVKNGKGFFPASSNYRKKIKRREQMFKPNKKGQKRSAEFLAPIICCRDKRSSAILRGQKNKTKDIISNEKLNPNKSQHA